MEARAWENCRGGAVWYATGEAAFGALLGELREAQGRIWLACPRVRPGVAWESIVHIARAKAYAGLDVRILGGGAKLLRRERIAAQPGGGTLRLALVDDAAYVGTMDIDDACIGLHPTRVPRRDLTLRLDGPPAEALASAFAAQWREV